MVLATRNVEWTVGRVTGCIYLEHYFPRHWFDNAAFRTSPPQQWGLAMNRFNGGCHCGNIRVRFETAHLVSQLPLRACQCRFCRKHAVRTTSDPHGRLFIDVSQPEALSRYSFSLHAAEFLVCARCGVYVGAALSEGHRHVATLNVNVLQDDVFADQQPQPADYQGENAVDRRQRRLRMWTPLVLNDSA